MMGKLEQIDECEEGGEARGVSPQALQETSQITPNSILL